MITYVYIYMCINKYIYIYIHTYPILQSSSIPFHITISLLGGPSGHMDATFLDPLLPKVHPRYPAATVHPNTSSWVRLPCSTPPSASAPQVL